MLLLSEWRSFCSLRAASVTPSRRTPSMLAMSSWVMLNWPTTAGQETAAASGTIAGPPSDADCTRQLASMYGSVQNFLARR